MAIDWEQFHKDEAVQFVKRFYRVAFDWRRKAYHDKWDKWERNYRSIYDPEIKAKKEPWQATMFVPYTVENVEVISASLCKIANSGPTPLGVRPREMGDELQAELNTSLIDYEVEKGDFVVNRYDVVKEATIFGSGFMKVVWEKKYDNRRLRRPKLKSIREAKMEGGRPGDYLGDEKIVENVPVFEGVKYQKVHIRDIFKEPNALTEERFIHRDRVTYGELKRWADMGAVDKTSVDTLWRYFESDKFDEDISVVQYDLDKDDPALPRPDYDKRHTIWEYWGPIPRKWVDPKMKEDTEDQKKKAAELVAGRILVASGEFYLACAENEDPAMENPLLRMDYIRISQPYGLGVCQIMEGLQEEGNELRNLRVDNVNLIINKIFVVLEKVLVDAKDVRSSPGAIIRIKGSSVDDVKKAIMDMPISDVPISSYRETAEIERQIQGATAANRMTTGTAGLHNDTNQTLGGMELLKQAAFDRFIIYAFLIGRQFDRHVARKTLELVYLNADDALIKNILGEQPLEVLPGMIIPRWQAWKRIAPHQFNLYYDFVPTDIFGQENKFAKSQAIASNMQLTATVKQGWNPHPALKKLWSLTGFSSEEVNEFLGEDVGMVPTPAAEGRGIPSISRPTAGRTTETAPLDAGGIPGA